MMRTVCFCKRALPRVRFTVPSSKTSTDRSYIPPSTRTTSPLSQLMISDSHDRSRYCGWTTSAAKRKIYVVRSSEIEKFTKYQRTPCVTTVESMSKCCVERINFLETLRWCDGIVITHFDILTTILLISPPIVSCSGLDLKDCL